MVLWEVACGCGGVFVVKVVNEWRSVVPGQDPKENTGKSGIMSR